MLIKKYSDGLSEIEIYDDSKLKEDDLEGLLIEIYDLCNEIARDGNLEEKAIKNHFYTGKKED